MNVINCQEPIATAATHSLESVEPKTKKLRRLPLQFTVRAILSNDKTEVIPLVKVFVTKILDRREIKTLLDKLPSLPANLTHLKRVKSKDGLSYVILAGVDEKMSKVNQLIEYLRSESVGLEVNEGSVDIVEVAGKCPYSRAQFETVKDHWPVNFNPDKALEKELTTNCGFDDDVLADIRRNVETLLDKSVAAGGVSACLVHDPKKGSDEVMICTVGSCAKWVNSADTQGSSMSSVSMPLRHAVNVAVDAIAVRQGGKLLRVTQVHKFTIPEDPNIVTLTTPPCQRANLTEYLCKGLDVYCSHEPCLMCAMTLLHARTNRVFFVQQSQSSGGLMSLTKLHCLPNINHRFRVYHVQIL